MIAIRIRGLGRYFGAPVEIDGAERPGDAWRTLLRIAGIDGKTTEADVQRTVAFAGHVLRDISLDVDAGSVVCVTGASGAGKSVLLRMLAGVIPPTSGSVELYGQVTSLLEVGDNLDVRLTAHENIAASDHARQTAAEASRYEADVIGFAELEGFEHVPLRTFSTGMLLRLSVALALCGRPSIVLIDDVLAVGDIGFQQKVIDRVHALKQAGCTLVMALSDDALVEELATRVITLGDGHVVGDTTPGHGTRIEASRAADVTWQVFQNLPEDDVMALRFIALDPRRDRDESHMDLTLGFVAKVGGLRCRPSVFLMRDRTVLYRTLFPAFVSVDTPRGLTFSVRIPSHTLPDGAYTITVSMATVQNTRVHSIKADRAVTLEIHRDEDTPEGVPTSSVFALQLPWEIEAITRGTG